VGIGTFRPVKANDITRHRMHSEYCRISPEAAKAVNETKKNGGRVIAVGTTACRTLESRATLTGGVLPGTGKTDIFIYPGYTFKIIDGLLTNFHLPESTLIMLVSALAGRERTLSAYKEAVAQGYRFFSYGDAMLVK
jgi:S-adenosylmethionine:tRNA ribosyltransferase-isomerase